MISATKNNSKTAKTKVARKRRRTEQEETSESEDAEDEFTSGDFESFIKEEKICPSSASPASSGNTDSVLPLDLSITSTVKLEQNIKSESGSASQALCLEPAIERSNNKRKYSSDTV